MNEQIRKTTITLQLEYGLFVLISLVLVLAFELNWFAKDIYASDPQMEYLLGTVGALLAMVLVPLSLKIFNLVMIKRIKNTPILDAIKMYSNWCGIRLFMLTLVVIPNIIIYYTTANNLGGFCALIGITASMFCLPNRKKIENELDITNKIEE